LEHPSEPIPSSLGQIGWTSTDTTDEIPRSLKGVLGLVLFLGAFGEDGNGVSDDLRFTPASLAGQLLNQSLSFRIDAHGERHWTDLAGLYNDSVLRCMHVEQGETR
jgi:hypothetical protein